MSDNQDQGSRVENLAEFLQSSSAMYPGSIGDLSPSSARRIASDVLRFLGANPMNPDVAKAVVASASCQALILAAAVGNFDEKARTEPTRLSSLWLPAEG